MPFLLLFYLTHLYRRLSVDSYENSNLLRTLSNIVVVFGTLRQFVQLGLFFVRRALLLLHEHLLDCAQLRARVVIVLQRR